MSMNTVNLMGRMVRDPEIRKAGEASVLNFTLAVDRDYTQEDGSRPCDFLSCVAWRSTAEFIQKHFPKGTPLAVTGRLQARSWEDDDGETHYVTEVVVDQVYFAGGKREEAKPAEDTGKRDKYGYKKSSKR